MMKQAIRQIDIDVLVAGGGGAACTAAVAAARGGSHVALVSKGKIGDSGNTIMIGGSYGMDGESAYHDFHIKEADPTFTRKDLFESIVKDGFYMSDQNMVEQFVEKSPKIVYEVKEWGEEAGQYYQFYSPSMWNVSGRGMGRSLLRGVEKTPSIDRYEDMMVIELLKKNGRVAGALALELNSGELVQFNAKAVVLGTGGFQPYSFKNTNSDMTGDGPAMALRAGAQLSDMEFMIFLVTALEPHEIRGSILPLIMLFRQSFDYDPVDKDGNLIEVPEKLRALEKTSEICKLVHIYYYGKAIAEGRGTENGGIYFDFSRCTDEQIDHMFEETMDHFDGFYRRGYYHGDDINEYKRIIKEKRRIEIGFSNEYCVGGILVDENMATTIDGLYAAGECASGVFGANRVADAVTEMIVQGYQAGESAAAYAKEKALDKADEQAVQAAADALTACFSNEGGISVAEATRELEQISDTGLGLYRDGETLEKTVKAYRDLAKRLEHVTFRSKSRRYNNEWIRSMQIKNRLACSLVAAMMALERKESRGLHLRSDYLDIDNDHYLVRQMAQLDHGEIQLTSRKPIVTEMELPSGRLNFETYLMQEGIGMTNV